MEQQLRQACSELGLRLRSNQPGSAEETLAAYPELAVDSTAALEIIYTEFVVREELGQRPQPEAWFARFPQWCGDLEELFQVHDFVVEEESRASRAGGSTLRSRASHTMNSRGSSPPSGDQRIQGYELGDEIGRGGMGVVYRARQVSLNRPVALKMILAGEYATPEDLARFHSEAAANAALQHPNIVQIFEVGEQDGHAYLAQEYVSGGNLQRKLAEWQADGTVGMAPKSAAGLLLVLSRAVHYAHQRGIVHRDLKPANVLLSTEGVDSRSALVAASATFVPKIADFGLAKMRDNQDAQVSHSGAILGTPSYMAPEQAAGRSADIGVATDVYALGALLYELLTGRPPFQGTSIMETLEQVRNQDPVRPSRLQPSIPRDLETICLKCLQKDPHRRYAGAAELADDLERFLTGKSIIARRSSLWDRAQKWSARQPALAALIAVSVSAAVLLVAGALFSNAALRSANERERERARQAKLNQEKAERHYNDAREMVDRLTQIGTRLADQPHVEKMRREVLEQALRFYQQILLEKGTDPEIQLETARACARVGAIQFELGQLSQGLKSYQQGVALLEQLSQKSPENAVYRFELATCLRGVALALNRTQRYAESEQAWREAAELFEQLIQKSPQDGRYALLLANTFVNRCVSLTALSRFEEAEQVYERAIGLHQDLVAKSPQDIGARQDLAISYDDLGDLYWNRRRAVEAERMCRLSYEMRTELLRLAPKDPTTRSLLARSCRTLGRIYSETGRLEKAGKLYSQGIDLLEHLRDEHPDVPTYSVELAQLYRRRAIVLGSDQDYGKATQEFRRLQRINPSYPLLNNSFSWHLSTMKHPQPQDIRESVALAKKAVSDSPAAATIWNTLGVAHYRAGEWKEAMDALQKSMQLGKDRDISNWFVLAAARFQLGDKAEAGRMLDEGLQLMKTAAAPSIELQRFRDEAQALIRPEAPSKDVENSDDRPL